MIIDESCISVFFSASSSPLSYYFTGVSPIRAFTPTDDPQYIVMNFSTINELNWAVPQDQWQKEVRPKVLEQLHELKTALPPGSAERELAWSTLMEYMNFPLDTPSSNSMYAIKMRRILEIADEENFPVFVPLNGFQWWDQLPELYNWWDPDGTHTDPKFFQRQKNPDEFKQRFIHGYNPENKWNVEWQDWRTPMMLNYRNWGGGGFRLAPPPDLFNQQRTQLTYRKVQRQRLKVILEQMIPYLNKWQKEGRLHLFAGLSIGTEISLNASVLPRDEFQPYGYRDVQDVLCDTNQPTCGTAQKFSPQQINAARTQSVHNYFVDLTKLAADEGIPKQRIYTHVWSEAKPGDPRYMNYAAAAATLYSRPGMSFYGDAQDPLGNINFSTMLRNYGQPTWGAVEYSAGTSQAAWQKGLTNMFDNVTDPAHIVVIYNWSEHKGTGAIPALAYFLQQKPLSQHTCIVPEIFSSFQNGTQNPKEFSWKFLSDHFSLPVGANITLHVKRSGKTDFASGDVAVEHLPFQKTSLSVPLLPYGAYSWYVEVDSCNGYKQFSEPKHFSVFPTEVTSKNTFWDNLKNVFRL